MTMTMSPPPPSSPARRRRGLASPSSSAAATALSALASAASCRSCGRPPSSSSSLREIGGGGRAHDDDDEDDEDHDDGGGYDGPLLVAPSCGHLFCDDCYRRRRPRRRRDRAGDDEEEEETEDAVRRHRAPRCPVCRDPAGGSSGAALGARPLTSSLLRARDGAASSRPSEDVVDEAREEERPGPPEDALLLGLLRRLNGARRGRGGDDPAPRASTERDDERPGDVADEVAEVLAAPTEERSDDGGGIRIEGGAKGSSEGGSDGGEGADEVRTSSMRESSAEDVDEGAAKEEATWEDETVVPGTCLSPPRRTPRLDADARSRSPEGGRGLGEGTGRAPGASPPAPARSFDEETGPASPEPEEPHPETEEVPGTYLSPTRATFEVPGGERLEAPEPTGPSCSSDEEEGETEVPGTLLPWPSNRGRGRSRRPSMEEEGRSEVFETDLPSPEAGAPEEGTASHRPRHFRIEGSQSEVPGTELPPLSPGERSQSVGESAEGPRRVSASPQKVRRNEAPTATAHNKDSTMSTTKRNAFDTDTPFTPSPTKRIRPNDSHDAIATDVRPWNLHSEPIMSPLTCEVRTCDAPRTPAGMPREEDLEPLEPSASPAVRARPPDDADRDGRRRPKKLYVACDVLDEAEARALSKLRERGLVEVVSGGVRGVSVDDVAPPVPFPAMLVTHAVDRPGLDGPRRGRREGRLRRREPRSSVASRCARSYAYLRARALGARVVDARWAVDAANAGTLLDFEGYGIGGGDLESSREGGGNGLPFDDEDEGSALVSGCASIGGLDAPLSRPFEGMTFGLVKGPPCDVFPESEDERSLEHLQVRVEAKALTALEIEFLVRCWGGQTTTEKFARMDVLLVDDCMTLNQVVERLRQNLVAGDGIRCWSLERWAQEELEDFIHRRLTKKVGDDTCVRIPVVRTKWLEDSICLNRPKSFACHCWGMLCF